MSGDVVAVEIPRSVEQVVALLGVLRAGAAYLPVDPAQPVARRDLVRADAGAAMTLTADDVRQAGRAPVRPVPAAPDDPAYLIYTSGSTGRPKGVLVPHRGDRQPARLAGPRVPARRRRPGAAPDLAELRPVRCWRSSGRSPPAPRSCSPARTATATPRGWPPPSRRARGHHAADRRLDAAARCGRPAGLGGAARVRAAATRSPARCAGAVRPGPAAQRLRAHRDGRPGRLVAARRPDRRGHRPHRTPGREHPRCTCSTGTCGRRGTGRAVRRGRAARRSATTTGPG